jgi:hypothetical protein
MQMVRQSLFATSEISKLLLTILLSTFLYAGAAQSVGRKRIYGTKGENMSQIPATTGCKTAGMASNDIYQAAIHKSFADPSALIYHRQSLDRRNGPRCPLQR